VTERRHCYSAKTVKEFFTTVEWNAYKDLNVFFRNVLNIL